MFTIATLVQVVLALQTPAVPAPRAGAERWIGTWATAAQPALPSSILRIQNQTLRLVVHTSVGGARVRVRISNTFGDVPMVVGGVHLARRVAGVAIEPTSDRTLTFAGRPSVSVAAGATVVSDPVDLDVPPLSDLAVSLFLPEATDATTSHSLARQTSYVSDTGDFSARETFPVAKTIRSWPFLTGVEVASSPRGASVVAFGSSTTDGDGSTLDANRRFPDVLAERLQKGDGELRELGVLNEGIIGNRLLSGSPREMEAQFGAALGESGLARFDRDVLSQPGVKYVILALGVNDLVMPGAFTPVSEAVTAEALIAAHWRLIARAHQRGVRIIGTTIPPFEYATFPSDPPLQFFTPEKEGVRVQVNEWIRRARHEFDGVVDFDAILRDPAHRSQLLAAYDAGDHLHMNDAGYAASANAIPLTLFRTGGRQRRRAAGRAQ